MASNFTFKPNHGNIHGKHYNNNDYESIEFDGVVG